MRQIFLSKGLCLLMLFFGGIYEVQANGKTAGKLSTLLRARRAIQNVTEPRGPLDPMYQPMINTAREILSETTSFIRAYNQEKPEVIKEIEVRLRELTFRMERENQQVIEQIGEQNIDPRFYEKMADVQAIIDNEMAFFNNTQNLKADAIIFFEMGMKMLENSGTYGEALGHFENSRSVDPEFASAHYGIGIVHLYMGNYEKAVRNLNRAVDLDPNYVDAYRGLEEIHGGFRNYDSAIESLNKIVKLEPDNAGAYAARGNYKVRKSELESDQLSRFYLLDSAVRDYTKAAELDPSRQEEAERVARDVYNSKIDTVESLLSGIHKALVENSSTIIDGALTTIGWRIGEKGEERNIPVTEALDMVGHLVPDQYQGFHTTLHNNALSLHQNVVRVFISYGKILIEIGETSINRTGHRNTALEVFTMAAEIDPTSAEAYFLKGQVLHNLEQNEASLGALGNAVELSSNKTDLAFYIYYRGMVHESLKNEAAAQRDFTRALQLDPDLPSHNEWVSDHYRRNQRPMATDIEGA